MVLSLSKVPPKKPEEPSLLQTVEESFSSFIDEAFPTLDAGFSTHPFLETLQDLWLLFTPQFSSIFLLKSFTESNTITAASQKLHSAIDMFDLPEITDFLPTWSFEPRALDLLESLKSSLPNPMDYQNLLSTEAINQYFASLSLDAATTSWILLLVFCTTLFILHFLETSVSRVKVTHSDSPIGLPIWNKVSNKFENTSFIEYMKEKCPKTFNWELSWYRKSFWAFNRHVETVATSKYQPKFAAVKYTREVLDLEDGGICSLDWSMDPQTGSPYMPIIVILSGLTGGSYEAYIKDLISQLSRHPYGYRCVVMNFRGCASTPLVTPKLYSGYCTADLDETVRHIKRRFPETPLVGVGFSLGGNVMAKYVSECGDTCPFIAATAIGNPFDLLNASRSLHSTFLGRFFYSRFMTANLIKLFRRHMSVFQHDGRFQVESILNSKIVPHFDEHFTRRSLNFKSLEEYYFRASCTHYLQKIRIPCFFLNALDDPVCVKSGIPFEKIRQNPFLLLATTPFGGHLGWWTGLKPRRWFAPVVSEWIGCMLEAYVVLPGHLKSEFRYPKSFYDAKVESDNEALDKDVKENGETVGKLNEENGEQQVTGQSVEESFVRTTLKKKDSKMDDLTEENYAGEQNEPEVNTEEKEQKEESEEVQELPIPLMDDVPTTPQLVLRDITSSVAKVWKPLRIVFFLMIAYMTQAHKILGAVIRKQDFMTRMIAVPMMGREYVQACWRALMGRFQLQRIVGIVLAFYFTKAMMIKKTGKLLM